jgi:hypothetical protein
MRSPSRFPGLVRQDPPNRDALNVRGYITKSRAEVVHTKHLTSANVHLPTTAHPARTPRPDRMTRPDQIHRASSRSGRTTRR